jgi:sugar lactone lactonase YvrE
LTDAAAVRDVAGTRQVKLRSARLQLCVVVAIALGQLGCDWFGVSDDPSHTADLRPAASRLAFARYGAATPLAFRNAGRLPSGRIHASVSSGFRIVDDACSNQALAPGASCTVAIVADATGAGTLTMQAAPGGRAEVALASEARVVVTPASARLRAGEQQRFDADVAVDWSVAEGAAGGTIDSDGRYTAPLTPGTYHVVAHVRSDPNVPGATFAVSVDAWVLDVVAGALGGPGHADGVGADARFALPSGIASDGKGNLYVADQLSSTIRKVVVATGAVTTLAGSPVATGGDDGAGPVARFSQPTGVALDGAGTLFIADSLNHTIRRLDLGTGRVGTVAGTRGNAGNVDSTQSWPTFNTPLGLAFDAASGNLYVADSGNDGLRKIAFSGPNRQYPWVSTLRDASNTPLNIVYPWGLACDGQGTLYVGSAANGTVTKVVVGTPPTMSVLTDGSGADVQTHAAQSVALGGDGRLYVGEDDPFPVVSFTPGAGTVTNVGATSTVANALAWSGDTLYLGDESTIGALPTTTSMGVVIPIAGRAAQRGNVDGAPAQARFHTPTSIVYDAATARAYMLDVGNRSIRQLSLPTGEVTTIARPTGTTSPLRRLYALTSDGQGNLYFIDRDEIPLHWSIRKVVAATGAVSTVFAADKAAGPLTALAADGDGNVYVGSKNAILRIAAGPVPMKTVAGIPGTAGKSDTKDGQALFGSLQALAWDGASTLYAADDSAIRAVAIADGTTTTIAGVADQAGDLDGTGPGARFAEPSALAFDSAGLLFIAEGGRSTVRRLDVKTGAVVTWVGASGLGVVRPGPLPAAVNAPGGIAVVGHGELLLTDANENAVLRVR